MELAYKFDFFQTSSDQSLIIKPSSSNGSNGSGIAIIRRACCVRRCRCALVKGAIAGAGRRIKLVRA
eukprot:422642-Pelagomonas_calceolata.AAC.5